MIKFLCFTGFEINKATLNAFDELVNEGRKDDNLLTCGYVIGAADGIESNLCLMERLHSRSTTAWNILTNQVILLDHKYCWNSSLPVPERAYIYEPFQEKFYHIQELTDRELREAHNLYKLYLNGGLEKWEELKKLWKNNTTILK